MLDENAVVKALCQHLERNGYHILQRCSTTEQGIDIIALRSPEPGRLLIEAKGGTSSREGSVRFEKGFSRTQVFDRVAKAFYTTASLHATKRDSGDHVGMAFPDTPAFRDYLKRIKSVTDALGFSVFLVREDLSVVKLG